MTYSAEQWSHIWSSLDTWNFTILVAGVFPVAGYLLFHGLKAESSHGDKYRKIRTYGLVILSEWALVAALIWLIHRHGLKIDFLGQNAGDSRLTLIVTFVFLVIIGFMAYFNVRQLRQEKPEQLEAELGPIKSILPENSAESFVFILVAFTAGICEELLYRGWLQNLIAYGTGSIWIGLLLAGVIFASGHAYQGSKGIIQTGISGLILGGVFIFTRGLVAGEILHTSLDAVNGIVGCYALSVLKSRTKKFGVETLIDRTLG